MDDGRGKVSGIKAVQVEWTKDEAGRWVMNEVPNSEKVNYLIPHFILMES